MKPQWCCSMNDNQTSIRNRFFYMITLLLVFFMTLRAPLDSDMLWHLRLGEDTLAHGWPVMNDIYSYTMTGTYWVNHSWLAEIVLVIFYELLGYAGLSLIVALAAVACAALMMKQMNSPVLLRAGVIILAVMVMAPVLTPRPQLFSLVMLSLLSYILYLYKKGRSRLIWWVIPQFWIWGNLHGGFPLGIILLSLSIIGEIGNHLWGRLADHLLAWKQIGQLSVVTAASALVVMIHPYGAGIWQVAFETVNIKVLQNFIEEWASPNFHIAAQQPFVWMLLIMVMAIWIGKEKVDWGEILPVLAFSYACFMARRNFGPFAIIAAPVTARYLWNVMRLWGDSVQPWIKKAQTRLKLSDEAAQKLLLGEPQKSKPVNLMAVGLLFGVCLVKLFLVSYPVNVEKWYAQLFPVSGAEWIATRYPEARVFNSYAWGGYMLWAMPGRQVFADGRTDLFGDDIIGQWISVVQGDQDWEAILERWQVDLVFIEPEQPIARLLPHAGWTEVFRDDISVIFVREAP